MMNTQTNENPYGVEEASQTTQLLPGSLPVGNQAGRGRQSVTGNIVTRERRKEWSRQDNIKVMECFYLSQPERRGYMKRMHQIWKERRLFSVTDQRIADQARVIKRNGLLSSLELEEIKNRVLNVPTSAETEVNLQEEEISEETLQEEDYREGQGNNTIEEQPSQAQTEIIDKLKEKIRNIPMKRTMPKVKRIPKDKIKRETEKVNGAMAFIDTREIGETNDLIYAGAQVVLERLNAHQTNSGNTNRSKKEPPWKQRLQKKLDGIRKDLGKLHNIKDGKKKATANFKYKYRLERKGIATVIEEMTQRLRSTAAKIKRYSERVNQFQQNHLFETDQKRFYNAMNGKDQEASLQPEPNAALDFWSNIWGRPHQHKQDAGWIKETENEYIDIHQQKDMEINAAGLKKVLRKLSPWKAAGPDGVQAYWVKNFTTLHGRLVAQLEDVMHKGTPPKWMTTGRTVLIPKDPSKGNIPSNYRPITCLPIMYKVMTAMISDCVYEHLTMNNILPWEQKGCGRKSRGTKDQLILDKSIMKESKEKKTNLVMGWIDYRKAYDMVPHTWITSVFSMLGISDNIKKFITESMKGWRTILESEGLQLGEVQIKRGIFQGDSLSPLVFVMAMVPLTIILRKIRPGYSMRDKSKINHLLYMDDLKVYGKSRREIETIIHTVRIFSDDIGMEFGLDKCATIMLRRGKLETGSLVQLPDGREIHQLEESEHYKYLGVLEADDIKHEKMKVNIEEEYIRRLTKLLKSKLNSGNLFRAINTWAVSLYRYGAGIVEWTQEELRKIDRRTRKLITMYQGMHPRSDVDRIYVEREKGGRGLMSIEDTVKYETHSLKKYTETSESQVIRTAGKIIKSDGDENPLEYRNQQKKTRLENWREKPMNGQHLRQTKDNTAKESWQWLKRGSLKRQTESLIIAAQDQALRTNYRKARIEKTTNVATCRLCKEKDETVSHLISECSKIAQTEYKHRHDTVAAAVHWSICKKHELPHTEKWYDHRAESVIENAKVKLLWDFNIQTDKVIEARRPDLVLVNKETNECQIIDIAIPGDTRVVRKEEEKIEKYKELGFEISRLWNVRTKIIPIVIGALGTISDRHLAYLAEVGANLSFETIQKSAILGTARIIRKALQ